MGHPLSDILTYDSRDSLGVIPNELVIMDNFREGGGPLDSLNMHEPIHIDQMIICFVMQGRIQARINGEDVVINGGQVLTALPESEGMFVDSSRDCRFILYIIYPEFLKSIFEDLYINYDRTVFEKSFLVESCSEEQMSIYQLLYTELKKECVRPNYEYKLIVVKSYLNALLTNNTKLFEAASSSGKKEGNVGSRQYDMFKKFLDALNEHARTERTVQFYADLLQISPKYLSYVSLQYTGKNASQWIGEYVVHHAKTLISIHHKTSAEIAKELEFPNLISYNRFFKRIAGISPKEYRKSLKLQNKK